MKPTPKAIENAARAIYTATLHNKPYEKLSLSETRILRMQAIRVLSCDLGDLVLVPKEATPEMLAAAIPVEIDDGVTHGDKVAAAGAVLLLEGSAKLGGISGATVEAAAFLSRDYRAMIAAAEGEPCK